MDAPRLGGLGSSIITCYHTLHASHGTAQCSLAHVILVCSGRAGNQGGHGKDALHRQEGYPVRGGTFVKKAGTGDRRPTSKDYGGLSE